MFHKCPTLEANRVILSPIDSSMALDLFNMWSTEGYAEISGFDKPEKISVVSAAVEDFRELNQSGCYFKWAIRNKMSGSFLGECELYAIRPQIRPCIEWAIGFSLKKDVWGKGFMTEALERILKFACQEFIVNRIKADVLPENIKSRKILEKLGFEYEGLQKSKNFINGTFRSMALMAHTRQRYHENI